MGGLLAVGDAIALYISFGLAFVVRFDGRHLANWTAATQVLPVAVVMIVAFMYLLDFYNWGRHRDTWGVLVGIIMCNLCTFIGTTAASFWMRVFSVPRTVLFMAFCINVLTQGLLHLGTQRFRSQTDTDEILVVAATSADAARITANLRIDPGLSSRNVVIQTPVFREWEDIVDGYGVIVIGPSLPKEVRERVVRCATHSNKHLLMVPDDSDLLTAATHVDSVGNLLVLSYSPYHLSLFNQAVKRVLDIVLSLILILLSSPIQLLLLVLIPLTSRGPVIYKQTRVGLGGRHFQIYKFRSMVQDAERYTGAVLASRHDPRVTLIGRFMRATRLDELPQLWNVLRGDMSLVGPRPERPEFVELYRETVPGYDRRHDVRPGITGFAQVMGKYTTEAADKLRYDLWYIRNYSPVLDLKILFQTVLVVLRPSQSAGLEVSTQSGAAPSE